jgi:hypothetical protein
MLRRYSKARTSTSVTSQNDNQSYKPPNIEMYEKRVQELTKTVEESQKKADRVSTFWPQLILATQGICSS